MKEYIYDMIEASVNHGIEEHPAEQMERLGYKIIKSEMVPDVDCWWFRVEDKIESTPEYLLPVAADSWHY